MITDDYISANTPFIKLSDLVLHPLPSTQTPHLEGEEATDRQSSILPIGLTNGSKNRPSATPPEHMVSISDILWLLDAFGLCYSYGAWLGVQILSAVHVWRQSLHESLKTPLSPLL